MTCRSRIGHRCFFFVFLCFTYYSGIVFGQSARIEGNVIEQAHNRPLVGAHIWLTGNDSSVEKHITSSDTAGYFYFNELTERTYTLRISILGYATSTIRVVCDRPSVYVGTIALSESTYQLEEKLVEGRLVGTEQNDDTTEYRANAFATEPDATADELILKLPGMSVDDDGSVKAEGEDVDQVLVDGQPFFGTDAAVTLRNLPADIIEKVQVYDKLSDQSQLTGFDDGKALKTMNIVTRSDRNRGTFGKTSGGYGTESRYNSSASVNFFDGNRRLSLIGLANNVNVQNFSQQDLLGVMGEGGHAGGSASGGMFGRGGKGGVQSGSGGPLGFGEAGSNFLVGQLPGTTAAQSIGINYSDSILTGILTNVSYFFNRTENSSLQGVTREYGFLPDSSTAYNQHTNPTSLNYNHRLNFRIGYHPDSLNEFLFTPHVYIQDNHASTGLQATSLQLDGSPIGFARSRHETATQGYSLRSHLIYRHRFSLVGRTFSINVGSGVNHKLSVRDLISAITYPPGSLGRPDSLNHESNITSNGYNISASVIYTEPLGTNHLIQLSYEPSYTRGISNNGAYDYDTVSQSYTIFNPRFSNDHVTKYLTQKEGISWRYRMSSFVGSAGLSYQIADLNNDQTFPRITTIDKTFYNLMPNALLDYDFTRHHNLRIVYRTSTLAPSITQLQDLVNKSNFLLLSGGNPDLKQSFTQSLSGRFSFSNMETGQSLFFSLSYNRTNDYIGSYSFITTHDTVIRRGIHLNKGAEFSTPINLESYWSGRTSITYGFPIDIIRSSLSLRVGLSTTSTPTIIKNIPNSSRSYTLSPVATLTSTSNPNLDFTISYAARFIRERNTAFRNLDDSYFSHHTDIRFHWFFGKGFVLRADLNNTYSSAPSDSLNRDRVVLNLHIGHKLFSSNRGELFATIHNLFNETSGVTHSIEESYIEDNETLILQRYFLLGFTYTIR